MTKFDVIVIGAGHAGVEAAWAAARMGCSVALCTLSPETVALMPCNPAVGGTAKGHLVREIDALGGLMGRAIDATGLQFKMLNRSRGPAVWSPRAQADKAGYSRWVRETLLAERSIEWVIGTASRILTGGTGVRGVVLLDGRELACSSLVITTGTFLNGLVHVGREQRPAGRVGEPPSIELALSLKAIGLEHGRLKTGTPPRLSRRSIDFDAQVRAGLFHVEHGDAAPEPFSFTATRRPTNKIDCFVLYTTDAVHNLVRSHIDESPLFNGQIRGIGPRYCPSLEDKVMRFPDRERHQLFLEPEGLSVDEIYVNGFSMSLPAEVQQRLVNALPGLEEASMVRPGYAVEYDFIQPTELRSSLETRRLPGLFLAGQINGTSGYEEAAGQGLIAGINAARRARHETAFTLARHEAYVGIMIDDLVTKGCLEPYRIFTSRAEHRLLLRVDNADLRLTPRGRAIGLVDDERWDRFERRLARFERNCETVERTLVRVRGGARISASAALRNPHVSLRLLEAAGDVQLDLDAIDGELDVVSVETRSKYEGYLQRQQQAVERTRKRENQAIPAELAYERVPGLSRELVQRFSQVRPETLGQALRIPGATPAAVAVLGAYVSRLGLAQGSGVGERSDSGCAEA
jgi:tRNA uridine 5-carboxymethylaminomethyl modification enzyme